MADPIKVIVVDDEETVRYTFSMLMDGPEWQLTAVGSAEEALELMEDQRFDVALIDKNMPGMGGLELLRSLRQRGERLPCFIMTAQASVESATEALGLAVEAYLEKPFDDLMEVLRRVREAIDQRRTQGGAKPLFEAADFFRKARSLLSEGSAAINGDGLRVLVSSNVETDRDWLAQQLGGRVGELVKTATVEQALDAVALLRPELAILDAGLPAPGVAELVRRLRQQKPDTVLVVIRDSKLPLHAIKKLIEIGVSAVLDRPLQADALNAKLEEISKLFGHGRGLS